MTVWFISRHPGAAHWAQTQNLKVDRHESHLDVAAVQHADTVIGTLPIHLAAQVCAKGAVYLNLSLDIPAQWRGRELDASEMIACKARLEPFHIVELHQNPTEKDRNKP